MTRTTDAERQTREDVLSFWRHAITPETTIYCILRSVSRTGMSRVITPLIIVGSGGPNYLARFAHDFCGYRLDSREYVASVRVNGAGFDACHDVAHAIMRTLHGPEAANRVRVERL